MSRRTEDDQASDLLADLSGRGFRICELAPVSGTYLDGDGGSEWRPVDDKRALRLLALLLLKEQDR